MSQDQLFPDELEEPLHEEPETTEYIPSDEDEPWESPALEEPSGSGGRHERMAAETRVSVQSALTSALAAVLNTGLPVEAAASLLRYAAESTTAAQEILGPAAAPLSDLMEHAAVLLSDQAYGSVWIGSSGMAQDPTLSRSVKDLVSDIAAAVPSEDPAGSVAYAEGLARKLRTADAARSLARAVTDARAPSDLMRMHSDLSARPPVTVRDSGMSSDNPSASDVMSTDVGTGYSISLSSGFWTLDDTLHTRKEYPMGYTRSGQLTVISARSGSGKTSCLNTLLPAAAADVASQGHLGRILYVQVEDDLRDVMVNMGFGPGRKYHGLADRVAPLKSSSKAELVEHFYREVLRAMRLSRDTGTPLRRLMPPAMFVDHVSALSDQGEDARTSSERAADLLLFGIANCDPRACQAYSGVRFEEYTGEAWPDDAEGFNLAVVTTIQTLLKGAGAATPYDPANTRLDWRSYAMADHNDMPLWEPQPGDFPLSDPQAVKGSTKIIENAQLVMFLHRPRVIGNVEAVDARTPEGYRTLEDTRGYFQILKSRFGQKDGRQIIPMHFNLQRNGGSKAQYFDSFAEAQIASGVLTSEEYDDEVWTATGDPLIPVRKSLSKAALVTY